MTTPQPQITQIRWRVYQQTETGLEKRCSKCGDYWPATFEFFSCRRRNQLHPWCKDCYAHDPKQIAKRQRYIAARKAKRLVVATRAETVSDLKQEAAQCC